MISTLKQSFYIVIRHWLVYRKDFLANISPTLADPLFLIISLGLGLSGFVSEINGQRYIVFLAPGLVAISALMTSFFETSYNAYIRLTYEGVYKAMMTSPIGPRDIATGELLWVALKGGVMSCIIASLMALFNLFSWTAIPALTIVGSLIGLCCGSLGIIATTLVRNINQFQTVYSFVISPMYFLSGIFFPVGESTPIWLYAIIQLSPLFHGVRVLQEVAWSTYDLQALLTHGLLFLAMTLGLIIIAVRRYTRLLWV